MLGLIRVAGLSLCVAVGALYAGADNKGAASETGAKSFTARLGDEAGAGKVSVSQDGARSKGDRLATVLASCADQTWPYIQPDCLAPGVAPRPAVRTVTVTTAAGPAATQVARLPTFVLANR